jgi:hypothetical protein
MVSNLAIDFYFGQENTGTRAECRDLDSGLRLTSKDENIILRALQ